LPGSGIAISALSSKGQIFFMISSVVALLTGVLAEGATRMVNLITRITARQTMVFVTTFLVVLVAPAADPDAGSGGEVRQFEIRIRDGRASSGDIRVSKGERVELIWTADTATELHLHGYDIERTLTAGERATMAFTAFATGRFPVTVHRAGPGEQHETLLYLEVHPR
jgi:hypothetical protein